MAESSLDLNNIMSTLVLIYKLPISLAFFFFYWITTFQWFIGIYMNLPMHPGWADHTRTLEADLNFVSSRVIAIKIAKLLTRPARFESSKTKKSRVYSQVIKYYAVNVCTYLFQNIVKLLNAYRNASFLLLNDNRSWRKHYVWHWKSKTRWADKIKIKTQYFNTLIFG